MADSKHDRLPHDADFVSLARADSSESQWLAAGELGAEVCLLRRFRGKHPARRAVLLVHGASANSRTFLVPRGGLVRHLLEHGLEVWTLDWRASSLLSNRIRHANAARDVRQTFDLGRAARDELKSALDSIDRASGGLPISLLGHCVGGALVAQALIDETLTPRLDRVVLTTLGVFFRVGVENWLKGNERVLEEATLKPGEFANGWPAISPWAATQRKEFAWPSALENLYEIWKTTPARHGCNNPFCHRVSFMFGMPYSANLVDAMHAIEPDAAPASLEDALPEHGFWGQFGDMPVGLYIEVAQSLRQGRLASVGAERDERALRERFSRLELTLITGNENQLWHRESIDIMHDWLQRPLDPKPRVTKFVESGFGHQDLFWCEETARRKRMYDRFVSALAGKGDIILS
jgi:hypothetical protein